MLQAQDSPWNFQIEMHHEGQCMPDLVKMRDFSFALITIVELLLCQRSTSELSWHCVSPACLIEITTQRLHVLPICKGGLTFPD